MARDSANMMSGIASEILEMAQEANAGSGPQTPWEHVEAFTAAVDWSERWIQCLLGAHAALFLLTVLTLRLQNLQMALFLLICGVVALAEPLNSWAAANWQAFATQNYFDKHGVFASVMLCAPLLIVGFIQLLYFLYSASTLLVTVKREELRRKLRRDGAAGDADAAAAAGVASGDAAPPSAAPRRSLRQRKSRAE